MSEQTPGDNPSSEDSRDVVLELNGQQEALLQRLVADDPHGRTAEEFIRDGLAGYFKRYRRSLP